VRIGNGFGTPFVLSLQGFLEEESLNDLEDEKMIRIYGECQLNATSVRRDTPSFTGYLWCLYVKEGMRKDEISGTQNLFAIFKGYRCGAVDRVAP
jgi:hypothetical protein